MVYELSFMLKFSNKILNWKLKFLMPKNHPIKDLNRKKG